MHIVETDACLPQAGNSHVTYNHLSLFIVIHAHFIFLKLNSPPHISGESPPDCRAGDSVKDFLIGLFAYPAAKPTRNALSGIQIAMIFIEGFFQLQCNHIPVNH